MEKRLRLFHFSKDQYGEPYYLPGIIFDNSFAEFSKIVEDLDSRINKLILRIKIKQAILFHIHWS